MSKHLKALIPGLVAATIVGSLALLEWPATVLSNYTAVQSGSTTFQSFDNAGVKSPGFVPVDGTGVEKATVANPWVISSATPMPISANSQTLFRVSTTVVVPVTPTGTVSVSPTVLTPITGNIGITGTVSVSPTVVSPVDAISPGNLISAINSPVPTGTNRIGYISDDPCGGSNSGNKTQISINQTGITKIVPATGATRTFLCSLILVTPDNEQVALVEGTGTNCGTSTSGIIGTSGATIQGISLTASGGLTIGSGTGWIAATSGSNVDMCLVQSGSGRIVGNATLVRQ